MHLELSRRDIKYVSRLFRALADRAQSLCCRCRLCRGFLLLGDIGDAIRDTKTHTNEKQKAEYKFKKRVDAGALHAPILHYFGKRLYDLLPALLPFYLIGQVGKPLLGGIGDRDVIFRERIRQATD
jgi:hypothetical protein